VPLGRPEKPDETENKWDASAHQLLVDADGIKSIGSNIGTIKRNTRSVIDASKEIGLELYACLVTIMQGKIDTSQMRQS
jgi:hypothetical protein